VKSSATASAAMTIIATKVAGSLRSVWIAKKTRTIAETTIAAIATEACAPVSARRR
jgi:hypothetical protein